MAQLIAQMIDGRILLDEAIEEFEKVYIQQALKLNGDNLSRTAAALGIHRNTLSKRVDKYYQNSHMTGARHRRRRAPAAKAAAAKSRG